MNSANSYIHEPSVQPQHVELQEQQQHPHRYHQQQQQQQQQIDKKMTKQELAHLSARDECCHTAQNSSSRTIYSVRRRSVEENYDCPLRTRGMTVCVVCERLTIAIACAAFVIVTVVSSLLLVVVPWHVVDDFSSSWKQHSITDQRVSTSILQRHGSDMALPLSTSSFSDSFPFSVPIVNAFGIETHLHRCSIPENTMMSRQKRSKMLFGLPRSFSSSSMRRMCSAVAVVSKPVSSAIDVTSFHRNDNRRLHRIQRHDPFLRLLPSKSGSSSATLFNTQLTMMMGGGSEASLLTCLIAGSVAGAVGVGVSYPLDTIKTKQQVLSSNKSSPSRSSPKMITAPPSRTSSTSRYHENDTIHKDDFVHMLQQEHQQQELQHQARVGAHHQSYEESFTSMIAKIYQQEGISGFYSGVTSTMIGQAMLKSMAFTTNAMVYQFLMQQQQHQPSSSVLQAFGESSASSSSSIDLLTNTMMTMTAPLMMSMSNIHLSDTECLLLAACFSGFITSFFVVPIERVKIMMQSQPRQKRPILSRSASFPVMDDDTHASYRTSGISSGMGVVASSSSSALAALAIRPSTSSSRSSRASCMTSSYESSVASQTLTYATTIISTVSSSTHGSEYNRKSFYENEFHCVKVLIEKDGWYGFFFRGLAPTILREVPRYGLYFVLYGMLMQWDVFQSVDAFYLPLICGAVAGCISWLPVYPADVIKTTIQNTEGGKQVLSNPHHDPVQLFSHLYEKGGGIGTFYRGLTPKLFRAAMINAVTFFMYDTVVDILSTSSGTSLSV